MKNLLKVEEACMVLLSIYLYTLLPYAWWLYVVLFLAPDISMLGYLINTMVGAFTYNFFHHKGVAILCYLLGIYIHFEPLQFLGLLLFGHSSFDRIMGYGLKYLND